MTPFDCYKKAWLGDNTSQQQQNDNNPFLSVLSDQINSFVHESTKKAVSGAIVDEAVSQGLIDQQTGKQILPAVELVCDKLLP